MGRKICITEEQYNMALREGVAINADVRNGDIKKSVMDAATQAKQKGLKPSDYTISVDGASAEGISENKLISKKQLQESRLKKLKMNSDIYSVKDFLKIIKK
jgi:C-terminal processing protease CtpA/Prc